MFLPPLAPKAWFHHESHVHNDNCGYLSGIVPTDGMRAGARFLSLFYQLSRLFQRLILGAIMNSVLPLNRGDTLNIVMAAETIEEGMGLEAIAPDGEPTIPSIIITVVQLD